MAHKASKFFVCLALITTFSMSNQDAAASTRIAQLCDLAATRASRETGVPLPILKAVARTETGRSISGEFGAWPWTLNIKGKGLWLATRSEALSMIREQVRSGVSSIDVGCFQINTRWHREKFTSFDAMLDPTLNAKYAARFLKQLYSEHGVWTDAVGAYHSRTRAHSDQYLARFRPILATMQRQETDRPVVQVSTARVNSFPLLTRSSGNGAFGSLFPVNTRSQERFIHAPQGRLHNE